MISYCPERYIPARQIIEDVARQTGAPVELIVSRQRHPALTAARAAAVLALREAGYSWAEIGRALGGRHHTAVMWLAGRIGNERR